MKKEKKEVKENKHNSNIHIRNIIVVLIINMLIFTFIKDPLFYRIYLSCMAMMFGGLAAYFLYYKIIHKVIFGQDKETGEKE